MSWERMYLSIFMGLFVLVGLLATTVLAGQPLVKDEEFLESDPDNDLLITGVEFLLGTDPYNSDSDNDGLDDFWEYENLMDPADASDAHMDFDYLPTIFHPLGEQSAEFSAIDEFDDGTPITWLSDPKISYVEPVFDEDSKHYDNYEEYYRPLQTKDGKIKMVHTNPNNPNTDGDEALDPDDPWPVKYPDDGTNTGEADENLDLNLVEKGTFIIKESNIFISNQETTSNEINPSTQIPDHISFDIGSTHKIKEQSYSDDEKYLKDADNDGI
jgi:hypothetical protein